MRKTDGNAVVVAKLNHWDIVGDEGNTRVLDNTGWTDKELKLVKGTNVKLRQLLSRSPYRFNFTIWLPPRKKRKQVTIRRGVLPYRHINKRVGGGLLKDKQAINVVVSGQGTAFDYLRRDRIKGAMPATPWILIHWLAEELATPHVRDRLDAVFHQRIWIPLYGGKTRYFRSIMRWIFQQVFPFRSAREGMLDDIWEEILVHYINTGGNLKISREIPEVSTRDEWIPFPIKNPEAWPEARKRFKEETEAVLESVLDNAVGKYIVV